MHAFRDIDNLVKHPLVVFMQGTLAAPVGPGSTALAETVKARGLRNLKVVDVNKEAKIA